MPVQVRYPFRHNGQFQIDRFQSSHEYHHSIFPYRNLQHETTLSIMVVTGKIRWRFLFKTIGRSINIMPILMISLVFNCNH